jgi:ribose/xylose/arabinose/galactoside ABC-type transport system permease subunit
MNMSETHRMIEREDGRLARSTGISVRVTRRSFLVRAAALAAAWAICPWRIGVPSAFGHGTDDQGMKLTLEAFADTLIPGQKRFPGDRAIAGVVSGPGAVQAGAIEMMNFPPVGLQPALFGLFLTLNLYALLMH